MLLKDKKVSIFLLIREGELIISLVFLLSFQFIHEKII